MDDNSISSGGGSSSDDLAAKIDSLEIDGTRPEVGDRVELKVSGSVSKIIDDCVYVTPEEINGTPVADLPKDDEMESEPDLGAMASAADSQGMGLGGY